MQFGLIHRLGEHVAFAVAKRAADIAVEGVGQQNKSADAKTYAFAELHPIEAGQADRADHHIEPQPIDDIQALLGAGDRNHAIAAIAEHLHQQALDFTIGFDHQNRELSDGLGELRSAGCSLTRFDNRQLDVKARLPRSGTNHAKLAAMAFDDAAADTQAESARAGMIAVGGIAAVVGSTGGIRDLDQNALGEQAAGDGDDFVARLGGGFFGVHQQIEQHLFHLSRRTEHDGALHGELGLDFDTLHLPFRRAELEQAG